jgi:hypothetical protein
MSTIIVKKHNEAGSYDCCGASEAFILIINVLDRSSL